MSRDKEKKLFDWELTKEQLKDQLVNNPTGVAALLGGNYLLPGYANDIFAGYIRTPTGHLKRLVPITAGLVYGNISMRNRQKKFFEEHPDLKKRFEQIQQNWSI